MKPKIKTTERGLTYVTNAAVGLRASHDSLISAGPLSTRDEDDLQRAIASARDALRLCNDILNRNDRTGR